MRETLETVKKRERERELQFSEQKIAIKNEKDKKEINNKEYIKRMDCIAKRKLYSLSFLCVKRELENKDKYA